MIDWPEPARPGVPLNPEQDGWHFLRMNNGTLKATLWRADGYWLNPPGYDGLTSPKTTAYWNTYLAPCLTPDEAAALQARADRNAAGFARVDAEADRDKLLHKREVAALQKRVAKLKRLVEILVENDPNDMAADAVTVLDVWRKEARAALAGGKDE